MQQYLSEKLFVQFKKPKTKQATALLAVFLLTATYMLPLVDAAPLTQPILSVDNNFINQGQTAHITMSTPPTGGSGSYNYEWTAWLGDSQTHPVLPGQTGNTCEFTPTTETAFGNWRVSVHVTDSEGQSVYSAPVTIAVVPPGTQRLVGATISPKTTILNPGQSVTISMLNEPSGGVGPYQYQWNGWKGISPPPTDTHIEGATGTSYTFIAPATYGTYQLTLTCIDTIGLGTWNTGGPATIHVIPDGSTLLQAPTISSSRSNVDPTQTARFTMTAAPTHGQIPFSYQWIKWRDWQPTVTIDGATDEFYDFTPDSSTPQGFWHFAVQVTDANGIIVQSQPADVRVVPTGYTPLMPPTISASDITVGLGQQIHFSTTQSYSGGKSPYTLQWNKWRPVPGSGPVAISGATSNSLDFTFNDASDYGMWCFCLNVRDGFNDNRGSNIINIQVLPDDYIQMMGPTVTPATSTLNPGETVTLSVSTDPSDGLPPYNYQWNQWMGINPPPNTDTRIEGETGTSYTFTAPSTYGTYMIMVNTMDSIGMSVGPSQGPSTVYVVPNGATVPEVPIITSSRFYVEPTQTASFTMTNDLTKGQSPYSYQWFKWQDWKPTVKIDGAIDTSYDFTATSATPQGTWHFALQVTDANGIIVQGQVDINVVPTGYKPLTGAIIDANPTMIHRDEGTTITATTPASGYGTITYHWETWVGNNPNTPHRIISGATGTSYTFNAAPDQPFGYYHFALIAQDELGFTAWPQFGDVGIMVVPEGYSQPNGAIVTTDHRIINPGQTAILSAQLPDVKGGESPYTYQWMKHQSSSGSEPITGATSLTYHFTAEDSTATGTWYFALVVTDKYGISAWPQQGEAAVDVVPSGTPELQPPTITASQLIIHPGDASTLTIKTDNPVSGGKPDYTFQWNIWKGSNGGSQPISGATTNSYEFKPDSTVSFGYWYFNLKVTDSLGCEVWSQWVAILFAPSGYTPLTGAVVSASPTQIHPGDVIQLSTPTQPTGGQGTTYQWMMWKGSTPATAIPDATTLNYEYKTDSSMAYGYWQFALVARDDYTEKWPTNGPATVLVVPSGYTNLVAPTIKVTPAQIIPGETIHLTMTSAPTGGYGSYSYQWYKWRNNEDPTPLTSPTTANPNYDYTTDASMLYGYWNFALVVTDSLGTQSWPTSTVIVAPKDYAPMQQITVYSNANHIHPSEIARLQTMLPISGGQQPYHYKWYELQSSGWTLIQDSITSTTYDFAADSSTSTGNHQFRLDVVDNLGFIVSASTTVQVLPKEVDPLVAPVIAASPTSIHPGDTIHLIITQIPAGGIEPYSYQLYVMTNGESNLIDVTPTTLDYSTTPTTPTNTLIFALIVKDSQGNAMMSMPITVQVLNPETTPLSVPGIQVDKLQIRMLDTIQLSIPESESVTGGDGKYTYQWIAWSQDNNQMYSIALQSVLTSHLDYTLNGYLTPGHYKFALVVMDGSGQAALGEPSETVTVTPFVAPEVPWGTTIFAIFASALVFVAVQRRRKTQQ